MERPDLAEERRQWIENQSDLDPSKLVFIDETGLNTKMTRLRRRAPCGGRCVAAVPHGHWMTTTFIAGLRVDGLVAPMLLDGPMDGEHFLAYIEQILCPELKSGNTVLMDSLPAHKVRGVREAIDSTGASMRYLPRYSPDLNPIEMAFAKLKAIM